MIQDEYKPTIFDNYTVEYEMHQLVDTLRQSAAKKHGGKEF